MNPRHPLPIVALVAVLLSLVSCAGNMERETDPNTGKQKLTATVGLGGKGARIKTKTTTFPDGRVVVDADIYSYDNEKSFTDATRVPITQAIYGGVKTGLQEAGDYVRKR